jgi:hypothetical protein
MALGDPIRLAHQVRPCFDTSAAQAVEETAIGGIAVAHQTTVKDSHEQGVEKFGAPVPDWVKTGVGTDEHP